MEISHGIKVYDIGESKRFRAAGSLCRIGRWNRVCANIDHCNRGTYRVKVTGTETKRDDDHDRYLVFTTDVDATKERVFENVDSALELKWNSSNLQARLMDAQQNNKLCEIRAYGFRIPFFSSYKNIVDVHCK